MRRACRERQIQVDGDALTWNVYRSTWEYLIKTYPKAQEQLELAPATREI
jgi:hypothetical protein